MSVYVYTHISLQSSMLEGNHIYNKLRKLILKS